MRDEGEAAVTAAADKPHAPSFRLRPSKIPTRYLFVANAGPKVGDTTEDVALTCRAFGDVVAVEVADPSKAQCLVTMALEEAAAAAQAALHGRPCDSLGGRKLWVQFSQEPQRCGGGVEGGDGDSTVEGDDPSSSSPSGKRQEDLWCAAVLDSASLGVPGATLIADFVTPEEEAEMLASTDADPRWQRLAKRRVVHYGYAFDYGTRNARAETDAMPWFVEPLLARAAALVGAEGAERATACDQLTVNEYAAGVGLAPHIDTHSAFGPTLLSVSLAGHAVMEFRLHAENNHDGDGGSGGEGNSSKDDDEGNKNNSGSSSGHRAPTPIRRASILLPPRSLLVLTAGVRTRALSPFMYIPHVI